jgi:hypothetical protein
MQKKSDDRAARLTLHYFPLANDHTAIGEFCCNVRVTIGDWQHALPDPRRPANVFHGGTHPPVEIG